MSQILQVETSQRNNHIPKHLLLKYSILVFFSVFIPLITFVGLIEIAVRINLLPDLTQLPTSKTVSDPYLGHRFEPNFYELDSKGWRNARVPHNVDIVSIGDSQTYGVSASRSMAYPQQLEQILDRSVYNMAMGGYSPIEYSYLVEEALTLNPKIITIGLYPGNDFPECYWASSREPWQHLQQPNFDYQTSLYATEYSNISKHKLPEMSTVSESHSVNQTSKASISPQSKSWQDILQPIVFRSKAVAFLWYRFIREWVMGDYDKFSRMDRAYEQFENMHGNQQAYVSYEDESIYIQMAPHTRAIAEDINNPVVIEGFRICSFSIKNIQNTCDQNNIFCLFVLIPTKELVYAPYLEMHDFKIKGYYADLIRFETINRMAIITLLDDLEANYVDVLNEMQKAALEVAEDGKLLYPYSADGHPNERGYQVIAKVIAEIIRQHSDLSDNKLF